MQLQTRSYADSLHEPLTMFREILSFSPGTCFVVSCGSELAGYVLAYPIPTGFQDFGKQVELSGEETTLYLHDLCICPNHRSKGLARTLHDALMAQLPVGKYKKISAVAVQDTADFWKKCGFTVGISYTYPGGAPGYLISKDL